MQLALALRSASRGAPPPLPFVVVASVATGVLLIGWRSALAALLPKVRRNCWQILNRLPSIDKSILNPRPMLLPCRAWELSAALPRRAAAGTIA